MPKPRPSNPTLQSFGENLRAARRGAKLTQEDLALTLDISVAYVSCLERGVRNPPLTTLVAIARAVGAPASTLLPTGS